MSKAEDRREEEWEESFEEEQVGTPFSTDRKLIEEGKARTGTNLDLGEERSREQEEEIERNAFNQE